MKKMMSNFWTFLGFFSLSVVLASPSLAGVMIRDWKVKTGCDLDHCPAGIDWVNRLEVGLAQTALKVDIQGPEDRIQNGNFQVFPEWRSLEFATKNKRTEGGKKIETRIVNESLIAKERGFSPRIAHQIRKGDIQILDVRDFHVRRQTCLLGSFISSEPSLLCVFNAGVRYVETEGWKEGTLWIQGVLRFVVGPRVVVPIVAIHRAQDSWISPEPLGRFFGILSDYDLSFATEVAGPALTEFLRGGYSAPGSESPASVFVKKVVQGTLSDSHERRLLGPNLNFPVVKRKD